MNGCRRSHLKKLTSIFPQNFFLSKMREEIKFFIASRTSNEILFCQPWCIDLIDGARLSYFYEANVVVVVAAQEQEQQCCCVIVVLAVPMLVGQEESN